MRSSRDRVRSTGEISPWRTASADSATPIWKGPDILFPLSDGLVTAEGCFLNHEGTISKPAVPVVIHSPTVVRTWIPAFAGMTGQVLSRVSRLATNRGVTEAFRQRLQQGLLTTRMVEAWLDVPNRLGPGDFVELAGGLLQRGTDESGPLASQDCLCPDHEVLKNLLLGPSQGHVAELLLEFRAQARANWRSADCRLSHRAGQMSSGRGPVVSG